jgi:hypothetical protein
MKIPEGMQYDLQIVPTNMYWKKVRNSQGEFTMLFISTTVGAWAFFMPQQMVTALRKGMQDMESPIEIARTVPRAPESGSNGART